MIDEKVSDSFWLSELVESDYATKHRMDNTPDSRAFHNIRTVLAPGLQRMRNSLGMPVFITSGYRAPAVNRGIGGARNSNHMLGLAADFKAPGFGPPRKIAQYLMERSQEIGFQTLIYEGTWVHIDFPEVGAPGLNVLTAVFPADGGPTTYARGLA